MRRRRASASGTAIAVVLAVAMLGSASRAGATPPGATKRPAKDVPRIIIDTDLSRWWDDATVIGMANVLQNQGKIRVLGIVSDVPNTVAVAAIDAISTAYGNDKIPIGAVANSAADTFQHGYTDALVSRLPHSIKRSDDAPGAVPLYRRLLAKQPDHSVTVVSIGGYTNLAGLLDSKGGQGSKLDGRKLVTAKVKRLVIEDGIFPNDGVPAVTNQKIDLAAASEVLTGAGWPTPAAWVDGQTGISTKVGATLCTATKPDHPMRIVYEALFGCGPPRDGDWDAPTLLYAINGAQTIFTELGQGGAAVINAQGGLSWQDQSERRGDVYVHVLDQQALNAQIDELLVVQ